MKYQTTINDVTFEIEINNDGDVFVNGEKRDVDFLPLGETLYSIITENTSLEVLVDNVNNSEHEVSIKGRLYTVDVFDERAILLGSRRGDNFNDSGEISIKSPMPGLIVDVPVSEGDTVSKGQTIIILESMKMQNELKAPRDGTVQRIGVKAGESVEQNKVLITLT